METAYEKYLNILTPHIEKFFDQQRPYIYCKPGCSICCESGQYPYSKIEADYLLKGLQYLDEGTKSIIREKIDKIKSEQRNSEAEKFVYECPFLINNMCSLYNYRGIICRSFGLTYYIEKEDGEVEYKLPACVNNKLNYHNVYDFEKKVISEELWKKTGIEQEPISYNLGLKFLLNNKDTQRLGLVFGEQKTLIDWL